MYILGTNLERGRKAAEEQGPNVIFHQCNVSKYQDLAVTFHEVHTKHGRVDYVFANAGATESCDILGNRQHRPAGEGIPAVQDLTIVDDNFNGVLYTSHLAMHYFRLSPGAGKGASLVITGSCGSLYPFRVTPMYAAKNVRVSFPLIASFVIAHRYINQMASLALCGPLPEVAGKRESASMPSVPESCVQALFRTNSGPCLIQGISVQWSWLSKSLFF